MIQPFERWSQGLLQVASIVQGTRRKHYWTEHVEICLPVQSTQAERYVTEVCHSFVLHMQQGRGAGSTPPAFESKCHFGR